MKYEVKITHEHKVEKRIIEGKSSADVLMQVYNSYSPDGVTAPSNIAIMLKPID